MTKIQELQKFLKLELTNILDPITISALKNLQLSFGIYPSGIIDDTTINRMKTRYGIDLDKFSDIIEPIENITHPIKKEPIMDIPNITTDLSEKDKKIIDYPLKSGQYINSINTKKMVFLHHTAGNANPYACIDDWNRDSRGEIGTHFVIGGINTSGHDGLILRAINEKNHAYHLGNDAGKPLPSIMTTSSISIELCNFGWLTLKNGKYYTYVNSTIDSKYVVKLDKPFRGYEYWHDYSDKQIESLKYLLNYIKNIHKIDIKLGLPALVKTGKTLHDSLNNIIPNTTTTGVWSHTNVRNEKSDLYPNPKLIKLFKEI